MDGAAYMVQRVRRSFYAIDVGYKATHAIHLATLVISLAWAGNSLAVAIWAFCVQQCVEPVAELLTGHYADKHGRRKSVVLGFNLLSVSGGLLAVSASGAVTNGLALYTLVGLGQALYLLGSAYISGALEAWAVDALRHHEGGAAKLDDLFSRLAVYSNFGVAGGGIAGLLLALYVKTYWLPWVVLALGMGILAQMAARNMEEPYRLLGEVRPERSGFKPAMADLFRGLVENAAVLRLTLAWSAQYALWVFVAYFWLAFLGALASREGMEGSANLASLMAIFWLLWCGLRVLGATSLRVLLRRLPHRVTHLLVGSSIATVLPLLTFFLGADALPKGGLAATIAFGAAVAVSKAFEVMVGPMRSTQLNQVIADSALRSMCLSLSSAGGALASMVVLGLWCLSQGRWVTNYNDLGGVMHLACWVALLAPVLYGSSGVPARQVQPSPTSSPG